MKIYGTVITALAVSNIINGIIAWCWAYQSINSISVPIKQGTDILGIVMAKASFGMFAYLISGIAIVVFAECISFGIYKIPNKKETNSLFTTSKTKRIGSIKMPIRFIMLTH